MDQGAPVNSFRWSPTADTMAYVVGSGVLHLRIWPQDSSESTVLTPPSPSASPGSFAWSPDGASLAYVWTGPDADGEYRQEIRLQPAAGGDPVTLFAGGNPVVEPTLGLAGWLPSGKGLLIWRGARLVDSYLPEAVDLSVLPVDHGQPFAGELPLYARDASWWFIDRPCAGARRLCLGGKDAAGRSRGRRPAVDEQAHRDRWSACHACGPGRDPAGLVTGRRGAGLQRHARSRAMSCWIRRARPSAAATSGSPAPRRSCPGAN